MEEFSHFYLRSKLSNLPCPNVYVWRFANQFREDVIKDDQEANSSSGPFPRPSSWTSIAYWHHKK